MAEHVQSSPLLRLHRAGGERAVATPEARAARRKRRALIRWVVGILALVAAAGALTTWAVQRRGASRLMEGVAWGNGRLEATQVDVATRLPGRVLEVLAREGDVVERGQLLARMDAQSLAAQLREAEANRASARDARTTALAQVRARTQSRSTAEALVAQRRSELAFARRQVARTSRLVQGGAATRQQLDVERTRVQSATAVLAAARSQVDEADAAIEVARSQVAAAESSAQAAEATVERIRSDLADTELRAPRSGRVQHRLVEPGEVIPAGGRVLVLVDLSDVYMTVFLPEAVAGGLAIGQEARLVLDSAPGSPLPAAVEFVSAEAQFTPKAVETASERQKLVFEVRLRLAPEVAARRAAQLKPGVPGVGYVLVNGRTDWPRSLALQGSLEPTVRR